MAGDFDSTTDALKAKYAHVPQRTFPAAKDMTDGELALEEAFERGAKKPFSAVLLVARVPITPCCI